tara:strand:+ start:234 stop:410 length:177 start_codon:yes stop_codon:yes gene_type:complete
MPKKWEIIDYFFTMYGEDAVKFTETVKEECNMIGIPVSNDLDPNDLLDLLIKNVEIKI